jgi:hypothetical protein
MRTKKKVAATKKPRIKVSQLDVIIDTPPEAQEGVLKGPTSAPKDIYDIKVIKLANNPRFVYGSLNGMRVDIVIGNRRTPSVNSIVTCERTEEENRFKIV